MNVINHDGENRRMRIMDNCPLSLKTDVWQFTQIHIILGIAINVSR